MNTATVLQRMKTGEALHLEYIKCDPAWYLSSGVKIQNKVARAVIRNSNVSDIGDALFNGVPSQTWRWLDPALGEGKTKMQIDDQTNKNSGLLR
jgi:hypothetical protein